jgi:hypothetical protein
VGVPFDKNMLRRRARVVQKNRAGMFTTEAQRHREKHGSR